MSNWKHYKMTEQELNKLVRDVYDAKIYTSLHNPDKASSCFMISVFLGMPPIKPSLGSDNQINRRNKLQYIEEKLQYEKDTPKREEYLKNIGMLYEEYSKAGPLSMNGLPLFMSCNILSIEDTNIFIEKYKRYEKMRKEFDKEFQ